MSSEKVLLTNVSSNSDFLWLCELSILFVFQDKQEREEEERKRKIQLYVFISRCIAYPFNAKQPTDMTRRQTKITKQQLETIQGRFQVTSCYCRNVAHSVEHKIL